jgi:membrane protein YqaA with SNARE-associated domain
MIRKVYDWMMAKANDRHALIWLAVIAFVESSFFPIPPDIMLIPMVLAQPRNWARIAGVATLASVIGGYLGYAIGAFAMDTVGATILSAFHLTQSFAAMKPMVDQYGAWVILVKGMTPIPYKLITITAGAFHFDLVKFTLASIAARGVRFFLVALLLWRFGPPIRDFVERRLKLVTTAFVILLVGGFVALKFL